VQLTAYRSKRMRKSVIMIGLAFVAASIVFVSPARGQRGAPRGGAPRGSVPFGSPFTRANFGRARRAGGFFPGAAFWPFFYADYEPASEPPIIETPAPQTIIIQGAEAAAAPTAQKASESLVLELDGDHWVRITNSGESQTGKASAPAAAESPSNTPSAATSTTARRAEPSEPDNELPAAVLVFRDGHKEQIRKYTVVGSIIYTNADYWTTGSWTRKIQVSELDVPATLRLNQEEGAKFSLPSGPNEIMVRP